MRRAWVAVAFIGILLLAVGVLWSDVLPPPAPGPSRENHVVDGQALGPESTGCPLLALDCEVAIAAAKPVLETQDPEVIVTATSFAQPACPDGTIPCTFAGLSRQLFVVFDLQGGSRRAIGVTCSLPTYQGQSMVTSAACKPTQPPS